MFIAKDDKGDIVHSEKLKEVDLKNNFNCLECGKPLSVRISSLGRKHFIHQGNRCPQNESEEHKLSKDNLAYWARSQGYLVSVEAFFKEEKRRGDLYLPKEKKILEVQCSPMSLREIKKRTTDYQRAGYSIQWVLGSRYNLKRNFTRQQVRFFQYHPHLGYYFFLLEKNITLYAHCFNQQGRSVYQKRVIPPKKDFLSLWDIENHYEISCQAKFLKREIFLKVLQLCLAKGYKSTIKEQEYFYLKNKHLLKLPAIYYELASVTLPFMLSLIHI